MALIGEHARQSTLGNVANVIREILQRSNVDADSVFDQAGVQLSRLNDPETRLIFPELEALLIASVDRTKDETFGLRFGELVHPTTFHALGLALLSSATIRAFCERLARYYTFITSNETIELVDEDEGLAIQLIPRPDVERSRVYPYLVQGSFATYLHWLRDMYRRDYSPAKVCFTFAAPQRTQVYDEHFGVTCSFSEPVDKLVIGRDDLDVPLVAANAELARMHDEVVVKFLAKLDERDLVRRVHAQIIQLLPSGRCSKPAIANSLHMSVRTLHNRLANEGTSYQEILVQTRRELAEQYMEQQSLSISEIAYTLGFSDCSNFSPCVSALDWQFADALSRKASFAP